MTKQAGDTWSLTLPLAPGSYGYKFLVDGSQWIFDPANPARKTVGGIENSAVTVTAEESPAATTAPVLSPLGESAPGTPAPLAASGASTAAAGLAPVPGEKLVTEFKLTPPNRALAARVGNARLTTGRMALAVPAGFDPAKSWPILVINNTENYSNIDAMNEFKEAATAAGWVVLGADPIEAEKDEHGDWRAPCSVAALNFLAASWPGAHQWPVACGGMSGGAKNSAEVAGEVAKARYRLIGMLMLGCNQDLASVALRKASPPQFLAVPIYLGSGKADTIATPEQTERVKESMRRTGFRKVRLESHDGAHVVSQPQVGEALRWFVEMSGTGGRSPAPSSFDQFFKKP
jgi:hypothetical protein